MKNISGKYFIKICVSSFLPVSPPPPLPLPLPRDLQWSSALGETPPNSIRSSLQGPSEKGSVRSSLQGPSEWVSVCSSLQGPLWKGVCYLSVALYRAPLKGYLSAALYRAPLKGYPSAAIYRAPQNGDLSAALYRAPQTLFTLSPLGCSKGHQVLLIQYNHFFKWGRNTDLFNITPYPEPSFCWWGGGGSLIYATF